VRGQRHAPAAPYTPGKDPVPIVQEAGWASGPVWTGAENLATTGIRYPDRPVRRQSLYRLSYCGPQIGILKWLKIKERSTEYVSHELLLELYEGWNFNSGNYLFTTDTK